LGQQDDIAPLETDPTERLENALDRIAYALHHRGREKTQPDWQALAANIDALRARVRDALGAEDPTDKEE